MEQVSLLKDLRALICQDIHIFQEGIDRFVIDTPFGFEDGDSFVIVLKKDEDEWYFTDEGHTLMHLSYTGLDVPAKNTRREFFFHNILKTHYIENENGEFRLHVEDGDFGNSLYTFIEGLTKITDLSFLKREYIASLFQEDFNEYLQEQFRENCVFDYKNEARDPDGTYAVDCYVNFGKPLFIFALTSSSKCKDAALTALMFKEWGVSFYSIGIFEEYSKITNKAKVQSMDALDKQFSTLTSAKEGLQDYLHKMEIC
jgi:hypothetical protein